MDIPLHAVALSCGGRVEPLSLAANTLICRCPASSSRGWRAAPLAWAHASSSAGRTRGTPQAHRQPAMLAPGGQRGPRIEACRPRRHRTGARKPTDVQPNSTAPPAASVSPTSDGDGVNRLVQSMPSQSYAKVTSSHLSTSALPSPSPSPTDARRPRGSAAEPQRLYGLTHHH